MGRLPNPLQLSHRQSSLPLLLPSHPPSRLPRSQLLRRNLLPNRQRLNLQRLPPSLP